MHFPTASFICSMVHFYCLEEKFGSPCWSLSNNAFTLTTCEKVVALVLTVSSVSARFVNEPYRATKFLSASFQRSESRRGRHTTVSNNKPTRTPLTDFCCAQPSLSSVDWTCLDRVCCDVPSKKDKDFFIVYEIYKKNNIQGLWNSDNKVSLSVPPPKPSSFEVQFCTGTRKGHIGPPSQINDCGTVLSFNTSLWNNWEEQQFIRSWTRARGTAQILRRSSSQVCGSHGAQRAAELLMLQGALQLIHSACS